ncbi:glypican-5-like [Nilaparvata lugens]|uniref:glypican-5-like n=1 Tax=Nilaparvata lugens TaxID=108931 RepID=UPI00193DE4EA|nr:glypican-5-like [Nilaparvata lugens]
MKAYQLVLLTGVCLVMCGWKCGPVVASPVAMTTGSQPDATGSYKYEMMDIGVSSCRKVWSVFEPKNLTDKLLEFPEDGTSLSVCKSRTSCCTHQMEERLKTHVQRDFQALLHHSSQTIQGLLISTANDLQDHVTHLARDSENRTHALFADVYRGMATRAREPIARLFRALVDFSRASNDQLISSAIPPDDADQLIAAVERFFAHLFPLVYHQAVHSHQSAFTEDYRRCVLDATASVQPFGAAPRRLGETLAASLQRSRTFAQALLAGGQVMNTTDRLMGEKTTRGLDNCFGALLRLTYCPRCQGVDTSIKPCNGYCLNVVRGCLTQQRAQELDLPWNNFLAETERLAKAIQADNQQALRQLPSSLSDAVMYAQMDGINIDAKVKKMCGPVRLEPETGKTKIETAHKSEASDALNAISVSSLPAGHYNKPLDHGSPLLTSFLQSLESIQAKGFFANLPEALCSDESFAEIHDTAECWNGQRVGEYTKTLVRPGVDAQKYNPELAWTESEPDPIIHQLSDKLRHIRQVVMGQLNQAQNLVAESYLRDEEDGSGSGQKPDDDDDDDTEWTQGSGSGEYSWRGTQY